VSTPPCAAKVLGDAAGAMSFALVGVATNGALGIPTDGTSMLVGGSLAGVDCVPRYGGLVVIAADGVFLLFGAAVAGVDGIITMAGIAMAVGVVAVGMPFDGELGTDGMPFDGALGVVADGVFLLFGA
jgi:hypothetical protein